MTQQGCPVGAVTDGKLNLTHTLPDNELWDENSSFWTVTKDGQPFDFLPFRKVETQDSRLSQAPTTLDKTQTSIKVRIDANTAISARVRYWPKYNDSFVTESNPQIPPLTVHVQSIIGLADGTTYCYQVLTSDDDGATWYPISVPAEFTTDDTITSPPVGNGTSMSFPDIAMAGPAGNGYFVDNDYIGEYLRMNPGVLDWDVQTIAGVKHVVPVDLPVLDMATATALPAPSGGDDTTAVQNVINSGGNNKVYYGTGVVNYRFSNLNITPSGIRIHQMPMEPANSSTSKMISINGTDNLTLIDCPQDGKNYSAFYLGIEARDCLNLKCYRGGLVNMYHQQGNSGGGVWLRNCHHFRFNGNTYKDILNKGVNSQTCRANAIWLNGFGGNTTDGGTFCSNTVENLQSTGGEAGGGGNAGNNDAEVFTTQSHDSYGELILVAANNCVDAGKRLIKNQTGGTYTCSNFYHWKTNSTPELGNRTRLAVFAVHFGNDDCYFRNNDVVVDGNRNWGYVTNVQQLNTNKSNNIGVDNNRIVINNPWNGQVYDQRIFVWHSLSAGSTGSDTSQEGSGVTFSNNTVTGTGGVNFHFWFGSGFDKDTGPIRSVNNTVNLDDPASPHQGVEKT